MRKIISSLIICWALIPIISYQPSAALVTQPGATPHVEAELISEVASIQPGSPFWLALRLKMEEHWHTYWHNPGDAGLATSVKWHLPQGFYQDFLQWPYPQRFGEPPVISYGYEGETLLLTRIVPSASLAPNSNVTLAMTASWLVCKEECLPGKKDLEITLPVMAAPAKPSQWADEFARARARLPQAAIDWKFSAYPTKDEIVLHATPPATFNREIKEIYFFPDEQAVIDHAAEQILQKTANGFDLKLQRSTFANAPPTMLKGVLLIGGESKLPLIINIQIDADEVKRSGA
jgi:thiol:disulfide interchange protein DsbD